MTHSQTDNGFRILSLDGGGVRGAFIAGFLAKLEEQLDEPLYKYFDLISGTSTGALVAVAIAMGVPVSETRELYRDRADDIFRRRDPELHFLKRAIIDFVLNFRSLPLDAEWLFQPKYNADALRGELDGKFGDKLLGEAKRRLVIPAVDLITSKVIVFKTPHRPGFIRDRNYKATDVVMASSAAPTYFPPHIIGKGSSYCDGGLWANNPAMVAYVEAVKIAKDCNREGVDHPFDADHVSMLSVGTGISSFHAQPHEANTGVAWWAPQLLNIIGEAQSEGLHWQMTYLLGSRYKRIDFDLPDESWALDYVGAVDDLIHIGEEKAVEEFPQLQTSMFSRITNDFVPFE